MESANTVGYSSAAQRNNGFSASGASFAAITGTMDLQDLSVSGYDHADGFEGDLNVQFLGPTGKGTAKYFWIDIPADPEDPDSEAFYGWYDGNDELAENVAIAPGTGLWTKSDSSTYGLQSAGQVITTDTGITLRNNGFLLVANPTPVDVDIQDIYVGGYNHADGFEGDVNVQFLGPTGKGIAKYFWIDIPADPEDPDSEAFYGWYDGNDELAENVSVPAGAAVWTKSDSSAYSLVFPGVTL